MVRDKRREGEREGERERGKILSVLLLPLPQTLIQENA
jgi:hypothetical protein